MNDLDFHVELYNAYLEPTGAKIEYLKRARKKGGYSKESFLLKLEKALDNLKEAWETEYNSKRLKGLDIEFLTGYGFPISALNRYDPLANFSRIHSSHISKEVLTELGKILTLYKLEMTVKRVGKLFDEKIGKMEEEKQEAESKPESKSNPLESIWMKNPSITINEFLEKGQDLGLWDEAFNLIAKRSGPYGSGKELLANISIVLKGHSINEAIDHKTIGKVFCSFFKIGIKPETENPFKQFQSGNEKQKQELKKRLK